MNYIIFDIKTSDFKITNKKPELFDADDCFIKLIGTGNKFYGLIRKSDYMAYEAYQCAYLSDDDVKQMKDALQKIISLIKI